MRSRFRIVEWILIAFALAAVLQADQRINPNVVLVASGGFTVMLDDISPNGKWLLIYIRQDCPECDTLLGLFNSSEVLRNGAKNVIVIVEHASHEGIEAIRSRFAALSQASWYVDTAGRFQNQARLAGVPTVAAFYGKRLVWSIVGLPPNSAISQLSMARWIERPIVPK